MKHRVFPLLFLLTLLLCVSVQAQNAPSVLSAELTVESCRGFTRRRLPIFPHARV